jgi:hypothetical protein
MVPFLFVVVAVLVFLGAGAAGLKALDWRGASHATALASVSSARIYRGIDCGRVSV